MFALPSHSLALCLVGLLGGSLCANPVLAEDSSAENSHNKTLSAEFLNASADQNLPFSDAVRVGPWLYLSGKIGNLPGTRELAAGGIQGETRQAMENIRQSLERYGFNLNQVVKCTVFLADMAEWPAMNEVYVSFFPLHRPARSALGASGLALNARVEIECIAVQANDTAE